MNAAERLILYVIQCIRDEGGLVSRTRLLKIMYLIDVEYFRRRRRTLTGWEWRFHFFGPYVHDYPQILERLSLSFLDESQDTSADGKQFYSYRVSEHQDIDDLVSFGDQTVIDGIIRRWSLENLNLLLNHVYFETEPMVGTQRGEILDFSKVPLLTFRPSLDVSKLIVSAETRSLFRSRLKLAQHKLEERIVRTATFLRAHPIEADTYYRESMERMDQADTHSFPDGVTVTVSE